MLPVPGGKHSSLLAGIVSKNLVKGFFVPRGGIAFPETESVESFGNKLLDTDIS